MDPHDGVPLLVPLQLASAKHTVEITVLMETGCLTDDMSAAGKTLVKGTLSRAQDKRLPRSGFPHLFIDLKCIGCLASGGIEWRVADVVHLGKENQGDLAGGDSVWTCVLCP